MQNKHFFPFWKSQHSEKGGGVKPVGTKSQVSPKFFPNGSPKQEGQKCKSNSSWYVFGIWYWVFGVWYACMCICWVDMVAWRCTALRPLSAHNHDRIKQCLSFLYLLQLPFLQAYLCPHHACIYIYHYFQQLSTTRESWQYSFITIVQQSPSCHNLILIEYWKSALSTLCLQIQSELEKKLAKLRRCGS